MRLKKTDKYINRYLILAILLFLPLHILLAENALETKPELLKLSGYYKNIFTASKTISTKEGFFTDTQRLRLELNAKFNERLSANLTYDNDIILNDFSHNPEFNLIKERDQKKLAFLDMDKKISQQKHLYWIHSAYRAYLKYFSHVFQCILGKQAIDWSRMRLYQPFDLFNPISPLDIEKQEKIGVDALNMEFYPDSFSSINIIYAPYKNTEKSGFGLKLARKIHDFDLSLIGADYKKDKMAGFGFDGYLKQAGFRGEVLFVRRDNKKEFLRAAIGLEHNFTPKLYTVAEYFYNGGAEKNINTFLSSYESSRQAVSMNKHILGAGVEYELSGVTKLANYIFYDFRGKSVFINPEFRYNILTNLDLTLGNQIFFGGRNSEFGSYENTYYAQVKYFF